jgi:glucose/arabinose dehydrogenase
MNTIKIRHLAFIGMCLATLFASAAAAARRPQAEPFDWRSDWAVSSGFALSVDSEGYQFPTAIAFVPQPGPAPKDPLYFVTELRGRVKVVTNDRSVYTFAEDFFRLTPREELPSVEGEIGLAGICLAPRHGYVFVTFAYQDADGVLRNNVVRLSSKPETFSTAATAQLAFTDIFAGYEAVPSHQIGNCQVGDDHLYVSIADGRQAAWSQRVDSILGKILRMTLDGKPVADNPFYQDDDAGKAANFVWASGFRNPFGQKYVDGRLFVADNGMRIDRFLEARAGENYLWNGNDWSLGANVQLVIAPAVGPVQVDYYSGAGSLFPETYKQHFFVALSAPQSAGVLTFAYSLDQHKILGTPEHFVRYRGQAEQVVAGLALGPDGLYFAPIMPNQEGQSAIFKVTYSPDEEHPFLIAAEQNPVSLMNDKGCFGCHSLNGSGGAAGPPLDRDALLASVEARLRSEAYRQELADLDHVDRDPFRSFKAARAEILRAEGMQQVRLWTKYHIVEPRFDNPYSQMPNLGLSEQEALAITDYLLRPPGSLVDRGKELMLGLLPAQILPRHLLLFFGGGFVAGSLFLLGLGWLLALRRRLAGRGLRSDRRNA